MLTTPAQGGGRTSSRFHVAKTLFRQLEPMVDAAMPLAKPYHQAPFWKFRYVSRCRSLLSTSSLFSGISCSPVRWRTCMLVANTLVPPRTHTLPVFSQTKTKEKSENTLNGFCISSLHSCSSNVQTRNHSKPSTPWLGVRVDYKHDCERIHQTSVPSELHGLQQCSRPRLITGSVSMHAQQLRDKTFFVVACATRRQSSLCHTPRKSLPHAIPTSLTCAYRSPTWTIRYHSVVRAFLWVRACVRKCEEVCVWETV